MSHTGHHRFMFIQKKSVIMGVCQHVDHLGIKVDHRHGPVKNWD